MSLHGGRHLTSSLSITVAVGCTLLFLNILIFAAIYYQRRRITKLRRRSGSSSRGDGGDGEPDLDPDDVKLCRKLEREAGRDHAGARPETEALIAGGGVRGGVVDTNGMGGGDNPPNGEMLAAGGGVEVVPVKLGPGVGAGAEGWAWEMVWEGELSTCLD